MNESANGKNAMQTARRDVRVQIGGTQCPILVRASLALRVQWVQSRLRKRPRTRTAATRRLYLNPIGKAWRGRAACRSPDLVEITYCFHFWCLLSGRNESGGSSHVRLQQSQARTQACCIQRKKWRVWSAHIHDTYTYHSPAHATLAAQTPRRSVRTRIH